MNLTTRIDSALAKAREALLAARTTEGCWEGELSGSPFSTAAAVIALRAVEQSRPGFGVAKLKTKATSGLDWLAANINPDGGWGDYPQAESTLLPTLCAWAALSDAATAEKSYRPAAEAAERWLKQAISGDLSSAALATALRQQIDDPVLVSSVLALCALSGRFGEDTQAWKAIPALPFEKAALPRSWFAGSRLTTLDAALPALIAAGQLIHFRSPTGNPLVRPIREFSVKRTLKLLEKVHTEGAGILESVPLTSIVLAGMAATGRIAHIISKPCMEFLLRSQKPDGAWALAANMPVTVTSQALDALVAPGFRFRADDAQAWLLEQQFKASHPLSRTAPGGWGWTNLPGGVPNSHDTAAALLALWRIKPVIAVTRSEQRYSAAIAGIAWLFDVQNSDGGMPTFSQGLGKSPLSGGCPVSTAASIRAWMAWRPEVPSLRGPIDTSLANATGFLKKSQQADGSWASLWSSNPIYGTSRVLIALAEASSDPARKASVSEPMGRAVKYLVESLAKDASIESTAWTLEALAAVASVEPSDAVKQAIARAAERLCASLETAQAPKPSAAFAFYSCSRYTERLLPLVTATAALTRVKLQAP